MVAVGQEQVLHRMDVVAMELKAATREMGGAAWVVVGGMRVQLVMLGEPVAGLLRPSHPHSCRTGGDVESLWMRTYHH